MPINLSLGLINQRPHREDVWRSGGIFHRSYSRTLTFYPRRNTSGTHWKPQSRSGRYGEERNVSPLPEIEPRLLGRSARILVIIPT
jgi:hypothetical protein